MISPDLTADVFCLHVHSMDSNGYNQRSSFDRIDQIEFVVQMIEFFLQKYILRTIQVINVFAQQVIEFD